MFLLPAQLHVFESAPCLLHESKVTSYAELADMAEVAASHLPSGRHLIALEMNTTPAVGQRGLPASVICPLARAVLDTKDPAKIHDRPQFNASGFDKRWRRGPRHLPQCTRI